MDGATHFSPLMHQLGARSPRAGLPSWPRLARAVSWLPRLVALLVAATLALLNPLSCVVHCAIHGAPAAHVHAPANRPGHHGHHGGADQDEAQRQAGPAEAARGEPAHRPGPGAEEPVTPPTPRASYELVSLAGLLLLAASVLLAVLRLPPPAALRPCLLAPPTPPPRRHSRSCSCELQIARGASCVVQQYAA